MDRWNYPRRKKWTTQVTRTSFVRCQAAPWMALSAAEPRMNIQFSIHSLWIGVPRDTHLLVEERLDNRVRPHKAHHRVGFPLLWRNLCGVHGCFGVHFCGSDRRSSLARMLSTNGQGRGACDSHCPKCQFVETGKNHTPSQNHLQRENQPSLILH